jgi:hypothetical protein
MDDILGAPVRNETDDKELQEALTKLTLTMLFQTRPSPTLDLVGSSKRRFLDC